MPKRIADPRQSSSAQSIPASSAPGLNRVDVLLTVSTVIAATIAAGLFVRSTTLRAAAQDASLMQLDHRNAVVHTDAAVHEPTVISAPAPGSFAPAGLDTDSRIAIYPSGYESDLSYDDRPLVAVKTIRMKVTAYSPDERSCGIWADGITFSGKSVYTNGMQLVAADRSVLPIGSVISVPGYAGGRPVPVLDIGGKIKGNRLDVLFPTHEEALRWGVKMIDVVVYDYAD